jgi:hypothetical protein
MKEGLVATIADLRLAPVAALEFATYSSIGVTDPSIGVSLRARYACIGVT